MLRFLLRFVGLWLIAGSLVAVVVDGARSIAASEVLVTPLGRTWLDLDPASLAATQAFVEQNLEARIGSWLWDPAMLALLAVPTFAFLAVLGGLLAWLGRKRRLAPAFA
ncbi:MAG TPA: hypothetical protein VFB16_14515 [Bauldia sp.]|nr:hypothetical protein [Bauldia sp.]